MRPRTQVLLWLLAMAIILGVGLSVHYAVDVKESSAAGPRTSASPAGSPGASPPTTSARTTGTSPTPALTASSGGGGASCSPTSSTSLSITAKSTAFDSKCLAAPAGKPFTVTFVNNDPIPHNFAIYTADPAIDPSAELLGGAKGPSEFIVSSSTTYKVDALKPGKYFFRCDFHPTLMMGTFVVG